MTRDRGDRALVEDGVTGDVKFTRAVTHKVADAVGMVRRVANEKAELRARIKSSGCSTADVGLTAKRSTERFISASAGRDSVCIIRVADDVVVPDVVGGRGANVGPCRSSIVGISGVAKSSKPPRIIKTGLSEVANRLGLEGANAALHQSILPLVVGAAVSTLHVLSEAHVTKFGASHDGICVSLKAFNGMTSTLVLDTKVMEGCRKL